MKIIEIKLGIILVLLRVLFKIVFCLVNSVEDVIVEIYIDIGNVGYGEVSFIGVIIGDIIGVIIGVLKDYIIKILIGRDVDDFENFMKDLNFCIVKNISVKVVIDIVFWDLYG